MVHDRRSNHRAAKVFNTFAERTVRSHPLALFFLSFTGGQEMFEGIEAKTFVLKCVEHSSNCHLPVFHLQGDLANFTDPANFKTIMTQFVVALGYPKKSKDADPLEPFRRALAEPGNAKLAEKIGLLMDDPDLLFILFAGSTLNQQGNALTSKVAKLLEDPKLRVAHSNERTLQSYLWKKHHNRFIPIRCQSTVTDRVHDLGKGPSAPTVEPLAEFKMRTLNEWFEMHKEEATSCLGIDWEEVKRLAIKHMKRFQNPAAD